MTILTVFGFSDAYAEVPGEGADVATVQNHLPIGLNTIDFSSQPQSTYLGTVITIDGVTFSTPDETLVTSNGGSPNQLSAHVVTNPPAPQGDFDGDIIMEFAPNLCASDIELLMIDPDWQVQGFGIDGTLLATVSSTGPILEIISFAGFPVHKIVTTGDFYAIDDISYTEDLCALVGGEFLQIDSAALILAGAQTNAVWIMSALAVIGSVAFGALYIKTRKN